MAPDTRPDSPTARCGIHPCPGPAAGGRRCNRTLRFRTRFRAELPCPHYDGIAQVHGSHRKQNQVVEAIVKLSTIDGVPGIF